MRPDSMRSMRARMTAALVFSITAMMLLVCSGLVWYARHTAEQNADARMRGSALRIEHDLANEGSRADISDELQDIQEENLALLIVDAQGRVIRRSQGRGLTWPRPPDDSWRVVTTRAGANTIVIGMPWHKTAAALKNQALVLLFLSLCVTLASAVGSWVLVGRTLSPIGALSREAKVASIESLRVRLEAPSQDVEVVELVGTLNGLLTRLSDAAASKGRFYAAASHELRTPLQALAGHLEIALHRDRTAPEYRAAIEEAYAQTRRLTSLVQDLLFLNQL